MAKASAEDTPRCRYNEEVRAKLKQHIEQAAARRGTVVRSIGVRFGARSRKLRKYIPGARNHVRTKHAVPATRSRDLWNAPN